MHTAHAAHTTTWVVGCNEVAVSPIQMETPVMSADVFAVRDIPIDFEPTPRVGGRRCRTVDRRRASATAATAAAA